ncbi:MAG: LapA family protein [bacterium]|nr:LapA family protein [bacterium]
MIILFTLGILLGVVAVFFALQNVEIITVSFFSWQLTGSLALILSVAIFSGVLITLLILLPESITSYFKYRSLKKAYKKLEEELRKQKELTTFAKITPPTLEDIAVIEKGAYEATTIQKI